MEPGEPQARRALRLPPSGQKEVLERQRIMHGVTGRVIEYPASRRGAQAQVRCARPACYHGKYYGGPNVRNPITANMMEVMISEEVVNQKGQPLLVYQKTAETA